MCSNPIERCEIEGAYCIETYEPSIILLLLCIVLLSVSVSQLLMIRLDDRLFLMISFCADIFFSIMILIIFSTLVAVLLNCLLLFFIHLKLELLTQFPASNDKKFIHL